MPDKDVPIEVSEYMRKIGRKGGKESSRRGVKDGSWTERSKKGLAKRLETLERQGKRKTP